MTYIPFLFKFAKPYRYNKTTGTFKFFTFVSNEIET